MASFKVGLGIFLVEPKSLFILYYMFTEEKEERVEALEREKGVTEFEFLGNSHGFEHDDL